jgi:hypothetical protein
MTRGRRVICLGQQIIIIWCLPRGTVAEMIKLSASQVNQPGKKNKKIPGKPEKAPHFSGRCTEN